PDEVQSTMVTLLVPLGRELRASIDFFEHQQDTPVTQVFVSGGSARSDYIVQILQTELVVPCASWNPTSFKHGVASATNGRGGTNRPATGRGHRSSAGRLVKLYAHPPQPSGRATSGGG